MGNLWDFIRALVLMLLFAIGGQLGEQPSPEPEPERPAFEVRPLQPVVGPTVPCSTDAECYELNPHVIEDPDCEWVDGECLTLEQRLAAQAQPDWSSGALTVCETEPGACD